MHQIPHECRACIACNGIDIDKRVVLIIIHVFATAGRVMPDQVHFEI